MKKLFLMIIIVPLSIGVRAGSVEINGIFYNLITKALSAEVAPHPSSYYSGDIVIPETVEYDGVTYKVEGIGENALKGSAMLTNTGPSAVHIPSSIKYIGKSAFSFCWQLKAVYITDLSAWCNITFYENNISGGKYSSQISNPLYYAQHLYLNEEEVFDLNIPEGTKEIKNYAFFCDSIFTSVSIPGTVEKIGDESFSRCISLGSVKIPNSVSEMGRGVFYGCTALENAILPERLTKIPSDIFNNCSSLKSVLIPDSVETIGSFAFRNCASLSEVHIPKSVKNIGLGAFELCTNIQKVTSDDIDSWCSISFEFGGNFYDTSYSANPLFYSGHLFIGDEEITEVAIPNNVDTLGFNLINCQRVKKISLHKGLKSLSRGAFLYCSGLSDIEIPMGVTDIGIEAFAGCTGLTSIVIPESVNTIGERAFAGCTGLTSIVIPESVNTIGESALSRCTSLSSICLPMGIRSIADYLCLNCSGLTTIKLSNTLTNIGYFSFANCSSLKDVYCYTIDVPKFSTAISTRSPFEGSYVEYATLHVPEESINKYKEAQFWSNFGNIVALTNEDYNTQKCAMPTISYCKGKLIFESETEGIEFITEITDVDIKKHYVDTISLSATYNINVYATKNGYLNSDVATATLCWIDVDPTTEGFTNGVANVAARAVLIQNKGGRLTVQGADDEQLVSVYSIDGILAGSAVSRNGQATVATNLQPGTVAIIKIDNKNVKMVVK